MGQRSAQPVLIIFGATASGKSDLAEYLFDTAGPLSGCAGIISADSMQVYRGMDIGTAKPSVDLRARIPHFLIDIRNPDEGFGAGDFVACADSSCLDLFNQGRLPVLLGGTGFYLRHFILGLPETPPSDAAIRASLKEQCQKRGLEEMRSLLLQIDPDSAKRIHQNDEYRILRALEVYQSSSRPLSSYRLPSLPRPQYRFLILALTRPRDELFTRIDQRVDSMIAQGLADEVEALVESGYSPADPGLRAIGYSEFFAHGSLDRDIQAVASRIKSNTRKYAKRQETYFASIPSVVPVYPGSEASIASQIKEFLRPLT